MTTVDSARDSDERQVRLTEREALANVRTVLELCAAGALRCSEKTSRPTAATVRTVDAHLAHGDFYADEPSPPSHGRYWSKPAVWPNGTARGCNWPRKAVWHLANHLPRSSAACGSDGSPTPWSMSSAGSSGSRASASTTSTPAGARDDFRGNWGGDFLDALSRYDGLRAIRLNPLGAYAVGITDTYQPAEPEPVDARLLKVLPNLDIVATGNVHTADRLILSAYAKQTADHVWTVSATSLLTAVDGGRDLAEFTTFVAGRTAHELPDTLNTLVADVQRRARQLTDLGHVRVIEYADPATAALIARDHTLRSLCRLIGDRHLAVSPEQELRFRKALIARGYVIPGCSPA
jgi:hypothetical protein